MQDWERDDRRVAAANAELLKVPGVHTVYLGRRYRNGRETGEIALCAFVLRKRRPEGLAPHERVPAEVAGIPTDVIEADPPRLLAQDDEMTPSNDQVPVFDDSEYGQIRGGISIEGGGEQGTLGCIARATDTANSGRLVLLSNQHILAGKGDGVGKKVRQPDVSCCCCGRKIGVVLRTRNTAKGSYYLRQPTIPNMDAGIALLNGGIECLAEIQIQKGTGAATELVRSVVAPGNHVAGLTVKKRGMRTGPTRGTAYFPAERAPAGNDSDAQAFRNQIGIRPSFPAGATTGVFRFAAPGDSGAVVLTDPGDEVAALLWASMQTRPMATPSLTLIEGIATPINDVMDALHFSIATAAAAGLVLTVPESALAPESDAFTPRQPQPATRSMLDEAQRQIEQTVHGRHYLDAVRRHYREIRALVRSNRRVGAVWQRHGGQAMVQAMLDAVGRPDEPIPSAVGARSLHESAARIAAVLQRYGSAALCRDIAVYEGVVGGVCGCSYNQLLARLKAGEPVSR